jgi:hypothetical protein
MAKAAIELSHTAAQPRGLQELELDFFVICLLFSGLELSSTAGLTSGLL